MKNSFLSFRLIRLFFFVSFLSMFASLFSQDCVLKLREAQRLYDQGVIENIPELLTPCINKGFTREDKLQAYKLLIQVYQFDDNTIKSEETILDFLGLFPEYVSTPADPPEFVQLLNSVEVIPRFSAGIHGGTGYNLIQVTGKYDSQGDPLDYGKYSSSGIPLNLGLFINFSIVQPWQLGLEIDFLSGKFIYEDKNYLGIGQLHYEETQNSILVPVTVTYDFSTNSNWTPYLRSGFGAKILLQVNSQTSFQYSGLEHDTRTGERLNRIANRNRFSGFVLMGGGLKYKLTKGYLQTDLRFYAGITNQTSPDDRYVASPGQYSGNDENWYYLSTDDDFVMHHIGFNVGYVRKFYTARKK